MKDRLLYCINDIKERSIPPIQEWVLKACDLNRDIRIDDKCQLTLPDIQLKTELEYLDYISNRCQDRAVCRAEESVKLNFLLPEAWIISDTHTNQLKANYKYISQQINDVLLERDKKYSQNNSTAQGTTSNDMVGGL